jgi:hypothetical protein
VSKENADLTRALLATQTLWEAISKARASVDATTWYATGGPEAEDFLDAIDHGRWHPLLRLWIERKATIAAHRHPPGLRERHARILTVLMCATLEASGISKRESRKRAAQELKKEKIFLPAPSVHTIERWQATAPPPGPLEKLITEAAISRFGGDDSKILQHFTKLVRVALDPFP